MRAISRILVPLGGGEPDEDALDLACTLARRHKAQVEIVYVIEVRRSLPIDADMHADVERGETILDRAERRAGTVEVPVETSLLQARDVGAAIVDEAVQTGADVIVMGLAYEHRFGEYQIGATAEYILKNAPCLVWLARQPMLS